MWKKNNIFFGFSLALMVTAAIFGALYLFNAFILKGLFGIAFLSESTMMIASLGCNIFVLNYYTKYGAYKTARGMIVFVLLCAAYIIYTYFGEELGLRSS